MPVSGPLCCSVAVIVSRLAYFSPGVVYQSENSVL
jgi:hypothetical protein